MRSVTCGDIRTAWRTHRSGPGVVVGSARPRGPGASRRPYRHRAGVAAGGRPTRQRRQRSATRSQSLAKQLRPARRTQAAAPGRQQRRRARWVTASAPRPAGLRASSLFRPRFATGPPCGHLVVVATASLCESPVGSLGSACSSQLSRPPRPPLARGRTRRRGDLGGGADSAAARRNSATASWLRPRRLTKIGGSGRAPGLRDAGIVARKTTREGGP